MPADQAPPLPPLPTTETRAPDTARRATRVRTVTAVLAAIPVIAAVIAGGGWFLLGLSAFIAAGLFEFYALARRTGAVVVAPLGYVLAGALLFLSPGAKLLVTSLGAVENAGPVRAWLIDVLDAGASKWEIALTLTVVAPLVALLFRREASRDRLNGWTVTVVGAWYVTWLLGRIGALRLLDAPDPAHAGGAGWVLLVLLATWGCDTGAFLVGSRIGRHKMMPWVSPGKTWEGATGGFVAATAVVALAAAGASDGAFGLAWTAWLPLPIPAWHVIPLGAAIAGAAILGDLAESMIKRDAGAKDASGAFPGHGGVLDRIDSVLFTAPLVYYYAALVLGLGG